MAMHALNKILTPEIKAELNMLYTEPPFRTETGLDYGLFCREHAYHTYFLCRLNGYSAEIKIGHYCVAAHRYGHYTLKGGADHAWCSSGDLVPIDLSMTFHVAKDLPNIERPVLGTGQNGPYIITYMFDEFLFQKYIEIPRNICFICYLEKTTFPASDEVLLDKPSSFLLPPLSGTGLADVYGFDIFAKITLHLHSIVLGRTKPLYDQMNVDEALSFIRSQYLGSLKTLRRELREHTCIIQKLK